MITKEIFIRRLKEHSKENNSKEIKALDDVIVSIQSEGSYFIKEQDVFEFLNNEF